MPTEPPPTEWALSLAQVVPGEDLAGVGADLEPGTVLAAYRIGLFPMGLGEGGTDPIGWWSPDPRGVLLPGDLHVSRSLRRSLPRFEVRVDTAFEEVVRRCADPSRDGRWITPAIATAYGRLHRLGWAHSVETWQAGCLVGGLYGLAINGLFAGESMFHTVTDASKAALVGLVELLGDGGQPGLPRWMVDVQWRTEHLATLGIRELPRERYLELLGHVLRQPAPDAWSHRDAGSP
ncbi:leucyl/phenylalanyl-tRNA--protein transferase [Ornithinicoccus hortensis]|uniref:Leucyl/phenylalanyl-tRNA--protein transferase n=1 Tax=Ornithinicoccus hortensis TaxID=82346 RepID=A0A542YRQ8_9MICO|nr:leucyl/phenylalanyl-tRNA--protein transferase [Ornithinicoccus hortensis]TQL50614.1 leucyl/phenylalanyl-tRNA--protein transferase [Ornithinicoccus hortensis]